MRPRRVATYSVAALGLYFVFSGTQKLISPTRVLLSLATSFDLRTASVASGLIVGADIAVGSYLIMRPTARASTRMAIGLLVMYSIGLAYMGLRIGWSASCACGGFETSIGSGIARNMALSAVLVAATRFGSVRDNHSRRNGELVSQRAGLRPDKPASGS